MLPSRSEAFPNGVIEAMAAGLPVVASAVGGLLDLVQDGRTGLLVPPGDRDALIGSLRRLIGNPGRGAAMGRAARAEVQQRYSFDRMVSSFEHLYLSGLRSRVLPRAREAEAAGI